MCTTDVSLTITVTGTHTPKRASSWLRPANIYWAKHRKYQWPNTSRQREGDASQSKTRTRAARKAHGAQHCGRWISLIRRETETQTPARRRPPAWTRKTKSRPDAGRRSAGRSRAPARARPAGGGGRTADPRRPRRPPRADSAGRTSVQLPKRPDVTNICGRLVGLCQFYIYK